MALRYWIYDGSGEQIGGPFETETAAAEAARLLEQEADGEYEADTYPRGRG